MQIIADYCRLLQITAGAVDAGALDTGALDAGARAAEAWDAGALEAGALDGRRGTSSYRVRQHSAELGRNETEFNLPSLDI